MIDARSTTAPQNLQELLDAAATPKAALQTGQQQYQTPPWLARALVDLLPTKAPVVAFDPQCAEGRLLAPLSWGTARFGCELDRRFADSDKDSVGNELFRITGNCVKFWEVLDELYPDLRLDCQVANPPFGLRWKPPANHPEPRPTHLDSTEWTWQHLIARTSDAGYGFFIAAADTVERLKLPEHAWVYLYQRFPAGVWENTTMEIGVVHWHNSSERPARLIVDHRPAHTGPGLLTPDFKAVVRAACAPVLDYYRANPSYDRPVDRSEVFEAFETCQTILDEEARKQPDFNLTLHPDGRLRLYLSTRHKLARKLSEDEVTRLLLAHDAHPLTLVHAVETRRLLRELVGAGTYTVSPQAEAAIRSALDDAERQAVPIMPVSDFERIAYADEFDALTAAPVDGSPFTAGRRYPTRTGSYRFTSPFSRKKRHLSEAGFEEVADHQCELSGQDAYLEVFDNQQRRHVFLSHPETAAIRLDDAIPHPEADVWTYFQRPDVPDVALRHPELVAAHREALLAMQAAGI